VFWEYIYESGKLREGVEWQREVRSDRIEQLGLGRCGGHAVRERLRVVGHAVRERLLIVGCKLTIWALSNSNIGF
jgi:hypothetical protein